MRRDAIPTAPANLRLSPFGASTVAHHVPVEPIAFDFVRVVVIRCGAAILLSEFGVRHVKVGDVVLLAANTLCGWEPEEAITATTIYLDMDYVVDQVFWRHAELLHDRLDAHDLASAIYADPAQILPLGEERAGLLMPWLDELVTLTINGGFPRNACRMQALWFSIAHVIDLFITTDPVRTTVTSRSPARPSSPRCRSIHPLRSEAMQVRELLRGSISHRWTLTELAARVHLSAKQLSRVFTDTYGKTPLAYLTMLRVEEMARLLRETDMSVTEAGRWIRWLPHDAPWLRPPAGFWLRH